MGQNVNLFQWNRSARYAFLTLALFTVFSWLCYVGFVKNPQNLTHWSFLPTIFAYSFQVFAQLHVVLCALTLFFLFRPQLGAHFFKALVAVYLISLCAELGGTSVGLLFGHYTYSYLLGPKAFGFVPFLVPLSWFIVASCAFGVSSSLFPKQDSVSRLRRVSSTAALIVLWDLTLDPSMSHVFSYWKWNVTDGIYFGAPWTNFLGWTVTGLVIGFALDSLKFYEITSKVPERVLLSHYFLFTGLSSGFLFFAGVYLPLILAGFGYVLWALLTGLFRTPFSVSGSRADQEVAT